MKYGKKYMFVACAALLLGMQSCDLEEYNPAGSTPDNVYKEQAGFEALVNSAYAFWGGQFYGREDFVLLLNGGGDLWINIANCGYGRQMSKYEELTASVGQIYNPQIQISAESETKRSIFREKDKTKRSKKESAQHSKSRNKSFVMTSVSAL